MLSGARPRRSGLLHQERRAGILFFKHPDEILTVILYFLGPPEGRLLTLKASPLSPRCSADPPRLGRIHSRVPRVDALFASGTLERAVWLKADHGGFPRRPRQLRVSQTRLSVLLRRGSPSHPSPRGPYRGYVGYLPPTQWRPSKSCVSSTRYIWCLWASVVVTPPCLFLSPPAVRWISGPIKTKFGSSRLPRCGGQTNLFREVVPLRLPFQMNPDRFGSGLMFLQCKQ